MTHTRRMDDSEGDFSGWRDARPATTAVESRTSVPGLGIDGQRLRTTNALRGMPAHAVSRRDQTHYQAMPGCKLASNLASVEKMSGNVGESGGEMCRVCATAPHHPFPFQIDGFPGDFRKAAIMRQREIAYEARIVVGMVPDLATPGKVKATPRDAKNAHDDTPLNV